VDVDKAAIIQQPEPVSAIEEVKQDDVCSPVLVYTNEPVSPPEEDK